MRGFIDRNRGELPSGMLVVHLNDIAFADEAKQE